MDFNSFPRNYFRRSVPKIVRYLPNSSAQTQGLTHPQALGCDNSLSELVVRNLFGEVVQFLDTLLAAFLHPTTRNKISFDQTIARVISSTAATIRARVSSFL
ncbi:hypothetical protein DsansV1_C29g0211691 [Dioscorea sansibarensis]